MSERCGAWMPLADEPCARLRGHGGAHRTRYAMDNQYRMQTGREKPLAIDGRYVE